MIEREFASRLAVEPEALWREVTSLSGINSELMPYLRMDSPEGIGSLAELQTDGGRVQLIVDLRLGGMLPLGRVSIEIELGQRHFTERSKQPMMKTWRHRRSLTPDGSGCLLVDSLQFAPQIAPHLTARFVDFLFAHRHRRLRARWGGGAR